MHSRAFSSSVNSLHVSSILLARKLCQSEMCPDIAELPLVENHRIGARAEERRVLPAGRRNWKVRGVQDGRLHTTKRRFDNWPQSSSATI